MNLDLDAGETAFRDEVRRFVAANLPKAIAEKVENQRPLAKDDHLHWQRALHRRGWSAPLWPREHGGPGWTPVQRYLFQHECAAAYAPRLIPFGLNMVGPVIIEFGTEAQKQRYLPKILASEEWWCQGYSEPESGSDLASLRTRAERDGEHYVIDGVKTWTTLAQFADRMFCLARTGTGGKKQEGISFFLIDMKAPGVNLRPIITFDGRHEINEVRLDRVRVPVADRVGEDGQGWTIAKFLLGYERVGIAMVAASMAQLRRLKRIAAAQGLDSPTFRDRVAQVEIELRALEMTELRIVTAEQQGRSPGPEASLLKIKGTEVAQAITELLVEAAGYDALPDRWSPSEGDNAPPIGPDYADSIAPYYFNWRKTSIYGGSNEIQRNIIAKAVLGL
ncbi:MAG: acyl-CoA dehydrogenase family protein [Alphaproteobacteria bacterium]|nr:acyl-CoA dehydrogenase family protein [Alphaproteobacteria bacterium]